MNSQSTVIFPLGFNCDCATFLRDSGLRTCAFPFDWLTGATLETRLRLLETKFDGFLEKANMQTIPEEGPAAGKGMRHCLDSATGFKFFHDFRLSESLESAFDAVKSKYERRIARLYGMAENANDIYVVWYHPSRPLTREDSENARSRLSSLFPRANVVFLEIRGKEDLEKLNVRSKKRQLAKNKIFRLAVNLLSGFHASKGRRREARRQWEKRFKID